MNQVIGIIALVALFLVILLLGWNVKKYRGLKKDLGDMVIEVSPGKGRRKLVTIFIILFTVILVALAIYYGIKDLEFGITSVLLLAFVIFNTSAYIRRMTQIHQKGILAYGEIIKFSDIKHYAFEDKGKKVLLVMNLVDKREFKVFVTKKDQDEIKQALVKRVK